MVFPNFDKTFSGCIFFSALNLSTSRAIRTSTSLSSLAETPFSSMLISTEIYLFAVGLSSSDCHSLLYVRRISHPSGKRKGRAPTMRPRSTRLTRTPSYSPSELIKLIPSPLLSSLILSIRSPNDFGVSNDAIVFCFLPSRK